MTIIVYAGMNVCAGGNILVVNQGYPQASDENAGTEDKPFRTISAAAKLANPGDTVLVHKGVYRERVTPARGGEEGRPIVYQAAQDEEVIVKGSEIWKPEWRKIDNAVYFAEFDQKTFKDGNPFLKMVYNAGTYGKRPEKMPAFRHCTGQVFVDGQMLDEKPSDEKARSEAGSWAVSKDKDGLFVHFPESAKDIGKAVVEISMRDRIFAPHRRGLGYIHVRDFIFEHCANPGFRPEPQMGAVSPRSGHHWLIENNTVRFAKTIGIDCGSEGWLPEYFTDVEESDRKIILGGNHIIRGNAVSDNGLCGIAGWNHKGTKVIGNIVERNNNLGFYAEEEMAGMKFHNSDVLVEANLVRDNNAWGIWIDNQNIGARVTRNVILGNAMGGLFVELMDGPALFDNNIIAYSRRFGEKSFSLGSGYGIYTHDASGATFANNLIFGTADLGILMRTVSDRKIKEKLVETSNQSILNNMVLNEKPISLPFPSPRSSGNISDFNVFCPGGKGKPLSFAINWQSVPKELKEKAEKANEKKMDWSNLDIEGWRKIMKLDSGSVQNCPLKAEIDPKTLILSISIENSQAFPRCSKVRGVDNDFNGNPIPETCISGPFQGLEDGIRKFNLWPVKK